MIQPDAKNVRSLQIFFKENEFMRTTELAQLANVSVKTIINWRKKVGIKSKPRFHQGVRHKKHEIQPVEKWNDRDWLYQKIVVEGCGVHKICRMANRNIRTVYTKVKKLGIPLRDPKVASASKNPCCDRKWLLDHYVTLGLTLRQCAKIANVCPYTIYNWLVKYHIEIRDNYEALVGERSPRYGKGQSSEKALPALAAGRRTQQERRRQKNERAREIELQENPLPTFD